jgi:hypothetical protein
VKLVADNGASCPINGRKLLLVYLYPSSIPGGWFRGIIEYENPRIIQSGSEEI